ncbi:aminoglycoside phosphotransferase family protein [Mobilitalea sibirica]|uniref:Aminoglycoside phosphotransferase family protein n=1 Tax=Mobilitalea sibirica TaxID=1462919 RepID=A0A8J7HA04_9FIRM|nr:aminoglycoside phosphotransferase family protein [Mobilitalea sibirica]MBH1939461.1 aminoglycoside phosphotransferase family protein [Mobilitalea sibirica]
MINLTKVLKNWGFQEVIIENQFHEDSSRQIFSFSVNNQRMLLKGIPDEISENVIKGNVSAHEYLGNQKHIAPDIIYTPDGNCYIHEDGFWFYVMEFVEGRPLEETVEDEYSLGKIARLVHSYTDYQYLSSLDADKKRFYEWFTDKEFKKEFDSILNQLPDFTKYDQCFIHTDLGPHNAMMRLNGQVILIDLDDSGIGSMHLDIGWAFIMQFVEYNRETEEMKYRFDLAMAFLQGYYENEKISRNEYDLIWQGAIFMHISYMKVFGPYAVNPLWNILKYGMCQKDKLWDMLIQQETFI